MAADAKPVTFTQTLVLPDGTPASHTAEALGYRHMADGSIAVLAACCGMVGGELCGKCNGIGVEVNDGKESVCTGCGGRGISGVIICPTCNGARTINGTLCANCNGRGEIKTEDTRSWHTFYDIGMPTSDGKGGVLPPVDPAAEVQQHVQNVAERHAARHKAKAQNLDSLMKPRAAGPGAQG